MSQDIVSLMPREAYNLQISHHGNFLVDIRSTTEYLLIGHPVGSIHVPWMDEPDWTVDTPLFESKIKKILHDQDPASVKIILICRDGGRSEEAAQFLLAAGYPNVLHVSSGFEGPLDQNWHRSSVAGWRYEGLPWEQM